ncbi:DUF2064 domain-containing protein [Cellulophaga sp. HaHaR_3_176]|uniref:TIGR04282 family arsenosugar biosynthesis glycosyltransferase n=1 Tax=Cellulophaga sp. HaHaR_3_176 TaxID=1942464 RepID=UPI001C1FBBAE|nr:DUF2064 domain-containing protein [Cellulophaga sp. HaHaR_3_176]QWX83693.1 DUF2064 domain-containing protein [Cellulophaga sp. HaHaR_3_176]
MIPNNNKTVLFVFSLSATIEAERKPLFGVSKKNISKQFFKLLNQNTLNLAKDSGVDVVWVDETQQKGSTFAERYFNAYKSLFNEGYEKVISIGNDTPNLNANHISQAIKSLSHQQMVFGPSKDGGIYLLGYTKNAFNEQAFKNFSWLTSKLSDEIERFAIEKELSFSVLETLIDIDSKNNALEFAYSNPKSKVSSYILFNYTSEKKKFETSTCGFSFTIPLHNFFLRGPPTL